MLTEILLAFQVFVFLLMKETKLLERTNNKYRKTWVKKKALNRVNKCFIYILFYKPTKECLPNLPNFVIPFWVFDLVSDKLGSLVGSAVEFEYNCGTGELIKNLSILY